jgi:hypothetical protein
VAWRRRGAIKWMGVPRNSAEESLYFSLMPRNLFGRVCLAATAITALGGCHILFAFDYQAPLAETGQASDGGAWDLRRDQWGLIDTMPPADAVPADAPSPLSDGAADTGGPVKISALLKAAETSNCDYSDTAGGLAPAGVCTIMLTVTNSTTVALRPLYFLVLTLTNKNLLLNADGGPDGAGATVTVPAAALGADGKLTPGDAFTLSFKVGLKSLTPYSFYADIYGDVLP